MKPKDPRRRFLMSGHPSSVRKYTAHFLSRGSFGVYSRGKAPVTVLAYHPNSRSPDPLSKGSTGLDTILLDLPSGFIFRFWLKRSAAYPPLPEGSTHLKLVNPTLDDQGVVICVWGCSFLAVLHDPVSTSMTHIPRSDRGSLLTSPAKPRPELCQPSLRLHCRHTQIGRSSWRASNQYALIIPEASLSSPSLSRPSHLTFCVPIQ